MDAVTSDERLRADAPDAGDAAGAAPSAVLSAAPPKSAATLG